MKIFIYYKTTDKPYGGVNSFTKALKKYIQSDPSIEEARSLNSAYDIFFVNSGRRGQGVSIDLEKIKKIKKYGTTSVIGRHLPQKYFKKIVCRVDGLRGIYTKTNTFDTMDQRQLAVIELADQVIFQSTYCYELFKQYGYNKENYSIIHNGVDQSLFNVTGATGWDKKSKLKVLSANWSSNPLKGYKTIAEFSTCEMVESYFVGQWPVAIDKKAVCCLPPMKQAELAEFSKGCDVFLHAAENDPCPNVVLEALSCGLPVLYHTSGGTAEIAAPYGIPLPAMVNEHNIQDIVNKIGANYDILREKIIADNEVFSIDYAAKKYFQVFRGLRAVNVQ